MNRVAGLAAAAVLVAWFAVPIALAADGTGRDGRVLMAFNGGVDVPAGQQAEVVIVVEGDSRIDGQVGTVVLVKGTLTLAGTADTVVVVNGSAVLADGSRVTHDVWTLDATVQTAPTAVVEGQVRELGASIAALGLVLVPAILLFVIGLALVTVVVAVVLALVASRQIRTAEVLIAREPVLTVVVGFVGAFLLPLAAVVAIVTVVGAPLGLAFLFMVLPALAYAGWIVAAIWIGDWVLSRGRGPATDERPVMAAVVGVILLAVAGLFPFVTAIASAFGFGALLVYGWRLILGHPVLPAAAPAAPPASQG